jgi:hypothetical protein
MEYILIVMLYGVGSDSFAPHVSMQEFANKEACESAQKVVIEGLSSLAIAYEQTIICVPKG